MISTKIPSRITQSRLVRKKFFEKNLNFWNEGSWWVFLIYKKISDYIILPVFFFFCGTFI